MRARPDDLALALAFADNADALTVPRFGAVDLHVDTKPDLTPVTDADRSVEEALRAVLSTERPDDAVVGEEFGGTTEFTGRQWVIDPIDGTKNFVRGVPVWASLIALLRRRRAGGRGGQRTGAASAVVGGRGSRRLRGRRRGCGSTARGVGGRQPVGGGLSFSSLAGWAERGLREKFVDLTDAVWRVRAFGDFYSYCLVAEGAVDIAAEPEVSVWDLAPLDIRSGKRAAHSPAWMACLAHTAAVPSRPTASCTTRSSRGCPTSSLALGGHDE